MCASATHNIGSDLILDLIVEDMPNPTERGDITGFNNNNRSCVYDYGKDWSLMQPVDRINLVSRGSFRLGADHTAYLELIASQTKSAVEYTPNQITTAARGANYPAFITNAQGQQVRSPYYVDLTGIVPGYNNQAPIRIRWRCLDCGPRQQDTTSDTYRLLAGFEGSFGNWDYKFGLSRGRSKAETVLKIIPIAK